MLALLVLWMAARTVPGQTNYGPYTFTTIAGLPGSSGFEDGVGSARFDAPHELALDSLGNIYVADANNETIRRIAPDGSVSTVAGEPGSSGTADGNGSEARFNAPRGLALDAAGNLYVADERNHAIRKITPDGAVSTFAGLAGVSGSANGNGSAARFSFPMSVAVDAAGNVYVADVGNQVVRKITAAGDVSVFAGTIGATGSADGAGSAARFNFPKHVAVDSSGFVYVAEQSNHTIRKISPAGVVSTIAGLADNSGNADGIGNAARFSGPRDLAVDSGGAVYVADQSNHSIRKITADGFTSTNRGLRAGVGRAD